MNFENIILDWSLPIDVLTSYTGRILNKSGYYGNEWAYMAWARFANGQSKTVDKDKRNIKNVYVIQHKQCK